MSTFLRSGIFAVIFLLMVGLSALLYQIRFRDLETPLDEIKATLTGLHGRLPSLSTIACRSYALKEETNGYIAHALVPFTVVPGSTAIDTTLHAFDAQASDSAILAATGGEPRVWEARSAHYYFVLTHKAGR